MDKNFKKIGVAMMGMFMMLTGGTAIAVQAQEPPNQQTTIKSQLKFDGPRYYQLKNGKIQTEYRQYKNDIVRYQKEMNVLEAGDIRVITNVNNPVNKDNKVRMIVALENLDTHTEKILKISDISVVKAKKTIELACDVTVPQDGDYSLKTYIWDSINGMVALKNTTVLSEGATNLTYEYDGEYNRNDPKIILKWNAAKDAVAYDIYVEDECVGRTEDTNYKLDLEVYTPYKITVQAVMKDGRYAAQSNVLYFMTEDSEESQDARMQQWEDDRFGMMITWGGHSVYGGEYVGKSVNGKTYTKENPYLSRGAGNGQYSEWIKFGAGIPDDVYLKDVTKGLTAENYDPKEWVRIAKDAGMKYIVLITKHHEGLTLFNTEAKNGWDLKDTAAKDKVDSLEEKDFLRQLIKEAAKEDIRVGAYYSQAIDWAQAGSVGWNPQRASKWSQEETQRLKQELMNCGFEESLVNEKIYGLQGNGSYEDIMRMNEEVIVKQVEELMTMKVEVNGKSYGIDTLWWDMGGGQYPEFNYNIMKKVVELDPEKKIKMNNRILHEGTYTTMPFDYVTPEQSIPNAPESKYWETCMTMNTNWGYAANDPNWKTAKELIDNLTRISSMGGNFLLNVGPKPDASFPQESVDLLNEVGNYIDVNGEAIYETSASPFLGKIPGGYATQKENKVYIHIMDQKYLDSLIIPGLKTQPQSVRILGSAQNITLEKSEEYSGFISKDKINPVYTKDHTGEKDIFIGTVIELTFDNNKIEVVEPTGMYPVFQDQSGEVTLLPNVSQVVNKIKPTDTNKQLMVEGGGNFGSWNNPEDYAQWKLVVKQPGTYSVDINYASPYEGNIIVKAYKIDDEGKQTGEAKVKYLSTDPKSGWVVYKNNHQIGFIDLPEEGVYRIEIHRENTTSNNWPINITKVHFAPVDNYLNNHIIKQNNENGSLSLLSKDSLRNAASSEVGTDATYDIRQGGKMLWKVDVSTENELNAIIKAATNGKNARVRLSALDEKNHVIGHDIEAVINASGWALTDNNIGKMTIPTNTKYILLEIVEGTLNIGNVEFIADDIILNSVNYSDVVMLNNSYSQIVKESDFAFIEQNILENMLEQGSGIYELSFTYRSTQPFETAIGIITNNGEGNWMTQKFDKADTWMQENPTWRKATVNLELSFDSHNVKEILFKPFNNFDTMSSSDYINIKDITLIKLNGQKNVIKNSTLTQGNDGLDQWNRQGVKQTGINVDGNHFILTACDAILNNTTVNEQGKRNITKEHFNDGQLPSSVPAYFGQLGNWWDSGDSAYWNVDIQQDGQYLLKGFISPLWDTSALKVEIKNENNDIVKIFETAIIPNDGLIERELGSITLSKGRYKISITCKAKDDKLYETYVITPYGIGIDRIDEKNDN